MSSQRSDLRKRAPGDQIGPEGPVVTSADQWSNDLAEKITSMGLAAPALLWGSVFQPLSFLGGQSLRIVEPLWDMVGGSSSLSNAADLLEDRPRLDRFLELLGQDRSMSSGDQS
jgi:hypothetical protein